MDLQLALEQRARVEEFTRKHRIGLLTLLFTDLVASTKLKQELGDREAVGLIQRHHALVREILGRFKEGQEIGTAGDSFFIVFTKPSEAAQFSLMLQNRLRSEAQQTSRPLLDRVGIHIGEVVVEERPDSAKPKDLYGLQVDICARVMSLAEGDQILLTRSAFDNARQVLKGQEIEGLNKLNGLQWLNHGPYVLKGVEEPLEICEVGEVGCAVLKPPPDSEKVHRYVSPDTEPVLGWRPALGQGVPGTSWVLEEKLGEGGFGEVWMGRHEVLKERRVFKFCFRADRVRSLKREVTLFRLLKERVGEHPNTVRLHEVYFDQPPFYLAMEYVPGRDLKSWCEAQGGVEKIPLATRLEIVAQVADALQAAHDAGVIHRDVKPSNVLIGGAEAGAVQVKLTDFGIGQVVSEEALAEITRLGFTQTVLSTGTARTGTQLYLAPELLAGNPASNRSDIYSLGMVLYQLLVGDLSRPLTADWRKEISDPVLQEDVGGCVAGHPEERIGEARELASRLRNLEKRQSERRAELQVDRAEELFDEGDAHSAVAYLASALRHNPHNKIAATRLISTLSQRVFPLPAYEPIRLPGSASGARFSPDGRHILTWSHDQSHLPKVIGFAQVWDAVTGKPLTEPLRHEDWVESARFSPDSELVVTSSHDKTARIWRVGSAAVPLAVLKHRSNVVSAEFSRDGRYVVTAAFDYRGRVWDARTGQPVTGWLRHSENGVCHAEFNPRGNRILTTSDSAAFRVWENPSGALLHELTRGLFPKTASHFSPDGMRLAVGSGFSECLARVFDAETGRAVTAPLRHSADVICVEFSPESARLLTLSVDRVARIWDAETGEMLVELAVPRPGPALDFDFPSSEPMGLFSEDGLRVLIREKDRVWVFDARTGKSLVEPIWLPQKVASAQFSPDGRHVLTASPDGSVRIWNLRLGEEWLPFSDPEGLGAQFIPPDDRMIIRRQREAVVLDITTGKTVIPPLRHDAGIGDLLVSPGGERIATSGTRLLSHCVTRDTFRIWDTQTGALLAELPLELYQGGEFTPDGKRLLTLGGTASGAKLSIWDAITGQLVRELVHEDPLCQVNWVQLSPDGQRLLTRLRPAERWGIWNLQDGQMVCGHPALPSFEWARVQFSPDGKQLLVHSGSLVCIWNLQQDEITRLDHPEGVGVAEFFPDATKLFTVSDKLRLWNAENGEQIGEPIELSGYRLAGPSPNGRRIVLVSDQTLCARILDLEGGKAIGRDLKHDQSIRISGILSRGGVRFSHDGSWFLTCDGAVRIFDTLTGHQLTAPFRLLNGIDDFEVSRDCGRLLTKPRTSGGSFVWDIPKAEIPVADWLPELGEAIVGRKINPAGHLEEAGFGTLAQLRRRCLERWETDPNIQWATWFFSAAPDRTISPLSSVKVSEYIEALVRQGRHDKKFLSEAIRLGPQSVLRLAASVARSLMSYPVQNPREARQAEWLSSRAVDLHPSDSAAWSSRASVLTEARRNSEALEALGHAIELDPQNSDYRWQQGNIFEALGQLDRAIESFAAALERNPKDLGRWFFYGGYLQEAGRLEEAYAALSKGLELKGRETFQPYAFLHARSQVLKAMHRWEEAAADNLADLGIPDRDPATPENLIDLSLYYDGPFEAYSGASALPRGIVRLAGTEFDLRGLVRIGQSPNPCTISIQRTCHRVNFLYAATHLDQEEEGMAICKITLRFEDDQRHEVNVSLGRDILQDSTASAALDPSVVIAWASEGAQPGDGPKITPLFRKVWENPRPEAKIDAIDLVPGGDFLSEATAFFLAAITLE